MTALKPGEARSEFRRDAAFFQFATVAGSVWNDLHVNGMQETDETGLPGVQVHLLDSAGRTIRAVLTDRQGGYVLDGLTPGTEYRVQISSPENTQIIPAADLSADALAVDSLFGTTEVFRAISDRTVRVSAGLIGRSTTTVLRGLAWSDVDGDGLQDHGETGHAAIKVSLLDIDGSPVADAETDDRGGYEFVELRPGGYSLRFDLPDGTTLSPMNQGTDDQRDSDANRFSRLSPVVPVVIGQVQSSIDVGIYVGPLSPSVQDSLRITEVGFTGHGNAEFVEVKNIGSAPIDLTGVQFTRGIRFDFSQSETKSLFPGEHAIVIGNRDTLVHRFDLDAINVAGQYIGDLNRQEKITMIDRDREELLSFRYDDDWFIIMDDEFQPWTLTTVNERDAVSAWDRRGNWRPSSILAGTPGSDDPKVMPDPGAVVINEVLTKSSDGFNDLIELHNTTDTDINIGYWYLGDSGQQNEVEPIATRTRYRIAPGTILPAQGYLVFSREQHFGNNEDPGLNYPFGLSSYGEAVHLIAADKYGNMMGYSDSVSFPSADVDMSFGRHVLSDGTAIFTVMSGPSFGAQNPAPAVGPLVIDAIFYDTPEQGDEFVRLYNPTDQDVLLNGEQGNWVLCGGVEFEFTDEAVVPARGYLIVAAIEPAVFREKYGVPASLPVFGPFEGALENGGEAVVLLRPAAENRQLLVDRVTYDDQPPWPVNSATRGSALLRVSQTAVGEEPSNWVYSGPASGNTSSDGLFRRQFANTAAASGYGHDLIGQYVMQANPGDANGDGIFTSSDLVQAFQSGQYEDSIAKNSTWSHGDWNGDRESTTDDILLAFQLTPYEPALPYDVDTDGLVTPLDLLLIINALNGDPAGEIDSSRTDTNGDGELTPLDALLVVNYLNR